VAFAGEPWEARTVAEELRLLDLSLSDARALLEGGTPVWLSINPVEFHGPHLSLHNDRLISVGLARAVHARLVQSGALSGPFVRASDLEVGVDPTPGPGTRTMSMADVQKTIVEACRALAELRPRLVIVMTWHGAPLHAQAIEAGLEVLRAAGIAAWNPFNRALKEQLSLDGSRFAPAFDHITDRVLRAEMMATLRNDFHGGFFETSMAMHYAPSSVLADLSSVPPCPKVTPDAGLARASSWARRAGKNDLADELRMMAQAVGWMHLLPFPGYTGAPHWARAESGAVFARVIEDGYVALLEDLLAGRAAPPAPPLKWVGPLTLEGRLSPKSVAASALV
jgi:creatinine amidohydrolase